MAAKSSPEGFVVAVATVTNPGSFMATITHPTGNGYCRDRILGYCMTYPAALIYTSKIVYIVI